MIGRAIGGNDLTVYGDGLFVRDYIYIDDVARAFIVAAENIEKLNGRHFLIGTGKGTSILDAFQLVADQVAKRGKRRVSVSNIDPPADLPLIETRNFVANISSYRSLTGWSPKVSLEEGVAKTVDWFLDI